jgi:hypothetical protein
MHFKVVVFLVYLATCCFRVCENLILITGKRHAHNLLIKFN